MFADYRFAFHFIFEAVLVYTSVQCIVKELNK